MLPKMALKKFHIILFVLTWNFSLGQQYLNYTIKDGLPSNRVYRVTQDNEGFIWAITDKGMAKFNGREFKVFTTRDGLPTNDIWDIRIDSKNRAWFFSKTSVIGYIENGRAHTFPNCQGEVIMFPASTNLYDDTVVFGGGNQWFFLEDACWKTMHPDTAEQSDNPAFKTLHNKALSMIEHPFFREKSVVRFRNKDSIMVVLYNEGFCVVNLQNEDMYPMEFKQYANNQNPNFIRNHFVNGQIQITGFDFVGILDKDFKMVPVVDIPSDLKAYFSMVDRSGNVWCATFSRGIFMLPRAKRQSKYVLAHQKVDQIKRVGDRIIANVYNKGFYQYDSIVKSFRPFVEDKGFVFNAVYIDTLKSAFFSSETKSIRITRDNGKQHTKDFFGKAGGLRSLVYLDGALYGNISSGVIKMDPKTLERTAFYAHYGVSDLLPFQDTLYMATSDGLKKIVQDTVRPANSAHVLFKKPVLSLAKVSDSLLMVNTDGHGAYLTDLKSVKLLPNSEYLSVERAYVNGDLIWLATEKGILKYKRGKGEYRYMDMLNENDGLPSKKVNSVIEAGNDLLVATDDGVAILPKTIQKYPQLLKIYIEKARYNQKELALAEPEVHYTTDNTLDFTIATIDFSASQEAMQYSYRLLPLQEKWVQTAAASLNFSNLPPNRYTLELKMGPLTDMSHFTIMPLWWQRPIAKVAFGSVALLAAFGLLYYARNREISKKTAKITAQKKMAEYELYALRAQMNPHFVFNSLAAIQYYINNNDFETSEKYLVKFSKLIRQFFELSKESEIPLETEIKLLRNYLDIEKLRFKEKLSYDVNIDNNINLQQTAIPSMLLQPIVENAVNHGIFNKESNGHIDLNFIKTGQTAYKVEVVDNGTGFTQSKTKPNGKVNSSAVLQDRVAVLNRSGQWEIAYSNAQAYPEEAEVGNISIFKIKKLG